MRASDIRESPRPTKVVLLFGPTAVGKTEILREFFAGGAEVVSADSLQVYRGLNIGTAKPDSDTLGRIPHHLIDIRDFRDPFNAGEFLRLADDAVRDIRSRGLIPVISGGTAYYMRSWLMGLPETPPSDPDLRLALERRWEKAGQDELRLELRRVDPISAERIGRRDRLRMLRALEVHEQTGRPLSAFPPPSEKRCGYDVLALGLRRNRGDLHRRIERRIEGMFRAGLAREVSELRASGARRHHPGMKGIGYREWFAAPGEPDPSPRELLPLIARNTRRYAKRQITFFSSLPDVHWLDFGSRGEAPGELGKLLDDFLVR